MPYIETPFRIRLPSGDYIYYASAQNMLYDYHNGPRRFRGDLQVYRKGVGWVRYDNWS